MKPNHFEDHFSKQAQDYARYRPAYPPEMFAYLARIAPARRLAWDCGTGNGQAALALAEHFERVLATDASAEQVARARPHERILYRVEPAEAVELGDASADLVTVAIAVHWFDFEAFYREVRRVLKPRGILAVWAYHLPQVAPEVDRVLADYYYRVLAGYWPERVRYLEERYQSLPFPFPEIQPPQFEMTTAWTLDEVAGFLSSWSATRKYQDRHQRHPVEEVWTPLLEAWGEPHSKRTLRWPLFMRVAQMEP